MSVDLLRTQVKTQGGFDSNTVGYLNPVWYSFRQFTHEFSSVNDLGGGNLRLISPSTTGIALGHKIRFAGGPYDGVKTGTVIFVDPTIIDISGAGPYIGTAAGHIVNLSVYRNLGIETELFDWLTGLTISKATSFWQTRPYLVGTFDLQSELRSLFYAVRETPVPLQPSGHAPPPAPTTFVRHITAGRFKVRYRETYIDVNGVVQKTPYQLINEDALGVPARRAIQEANGNNLIDYVLKSTQLSGNLPILSNPGFTGTLLPWNNQQIESDELPFGWSNDQAFLALPANSVADPHFQSQPGNWQQRGYQFTNPLFYDENGIDTSLGSAGFGWQQVAEPGVFAWQFGNGRAGTTAGGIDPTEKTYRLGQDGAIPSGAAVFTLNVQALELAGSPTGGNVTLELYNTAGMLIASQTLSMPPSSTTQFSIVLPANGSVGLYFQLTNNGTQSRNFRVSSPAFTDLQPAWSGQNPTVTFAILSIENVRRFARFLFNPYPFAGSSAGYHKMKVRFAVTNSGANPCYLEILINQFTSIYDNRSNPDPGILFASGAVPVGTSVIEGVLDYNQTNPARLGLAVHVASNDGPVTVTVFFFGELEDMQVLGQSLVLGAGNRTVNVRLNPSVRQFQLQVIAYDTLPVFESLATVEEFRSTPQSFDLNIPITVVTPRTNLGLWFQNVEGPSIAVDFAQINSVVLGPAIAPGKFHTRFPEPIVVVGPLPQTVWQFDSVIEIGASVYQVSLGTVPGGFAVNQPIRIVGGQFDDPGRIVAVGVGTIDVSDLRTGLGNFLNGGSVYNFALQPSPLRRAVTFSIDRNSENDVAGNPSMRVTYLDINRQAITLQQGTPYQMGFPTNLGAGVYSFLVEPGLFPVGTAFIQVFISRDFANNDTICEPKVYRLVQGCSPFVLVEWENSLGGFEQWLFQRRIFTSKQSGGIAPAVTERYDPDIENSKGNLYRDETAVQMTLTLGDEFVPFEDIAWLDEVKRSKSVRITFENGAQVYAVPTSDLTTYDTRSRFVPFNLALRLPAGFNPRLSDARI